MRTKQEGKRSTLHTLHSSHFENSRNKDTLFYFEGSLDQKDGSCRVHMVSGENKKEKEKERPVSWKKASKAAPHCS